MQESALLGTGALAGEWVLDPHGSTVAVNSRSMGLVQVKVIFREVSGQGSVSADGTVTGTLVLGAASLDTRNARRDKHLRSADFFDTAHYPDITFQLTGVRPSGQDVAVAGMLTVRGQTRPLSFEAAVSVHDTEVWLDAQVVIDRTEYGLTWNWLGMMAKQCTVSIHAVFARR
jgi:polyisoprenoid-binding protein YceI